MSPRTGNNVADPSGFRSGYVSITGRPNVGKSTFLNAVLGQKVSIVTPKPQTTRNRIIGIKTFEKAQVIFMDTPGIHRPEHALGDFMVREAKAALADVDVVLLMVEPRPPTNADLDVLKLLEKLTKPVILLVNKTDKVKKPSLLPVIEQYDRLFRFGAIIPISALKGDGLGLVVEKVLGYLPPGPKYYPDDLFTDRLERFMVAEIVREKVMLATQEEVPHSTAVEVYEWVEKEGGMIVIGANIYVEKRGQKGIIIGKKGSMLKNIGISARRDIERLLGTGIYLELFVKVRERWRSDRSTLTDLGLS